MKKKIVGVLGLGIFGERVATELSEYGCEVIVIDTDAAKVQKISEQVTNATIGDFTDIELLRNVGINNCDVVVIATGTHLESAVLAVMHCKKLGVPQIVAKARSLMFEDVLYEVGVSAVVAPERDSGHRLASKILRNKIDEVLRLDDDTSIIEFEIPEAWIGKLVTNLGLRRKYEINLIGQRSERGENLTGINIAEPLQEDVILVGIANTHTFEKFDYLGQL